MLAKVVLVVCVASAAAKLPDYIPICNRVDPNLEECILKAINTLRPRLLEGIPELDVIPLSAVQIDEIAYSPASSSNTISGRNVTVSVSEDFRVGGLKILRDDVDRNTFKIYTEVPTLTASGHYILDVPTPLLRVKGTGNIHGTLSDIRADGMFECKLKKRRGKTYCRVRVLEMDVKLGRFNVDLDGLPKVQKDIVINMINERSLEFASLFEPMAERVLTTLLPQWYNKVSRHLPLEDMFPS